MSLHHGLMVVLLALLFTVQIGGLLLLERIVRRAGMKQGKGADLHWY
jgi:hypothetical protein